MGYCGGCGGVPVAQWANGFHPELEPDVETNDRGMFLLPGDSYDCEAYHGMYTGSTVFLACGGTEWAVIFEPTQRVAATEYATQHECGVQRISVVSLCDARMRAYYGEPALA